MATTLKTMIVRTCWGASMLLMAAQKVLVHVTSTHVQCSRVCTVDSGAGVLHAAASCTH